MNKTLTTFLREVTERVIAQGINADASEVEVRPAPAALGTGGPGGPVPQTTTLEASPEN